MLRFICFSSLLMGAASSALAGRVALVIGNGAYESARLPNPPNDVQMISQGLTQVGFKVIQKTNLGREAMMTTVREFSDTIKAGDVALFYYAGHGAQVKGANHLIPVDAPMGMKEFEAEHRNVSANLVLDALAESGSKLNIVILDCCRNNPFARSWRSANLGLAEMKAPQETLIGYATAPGSAALDGEGSHSPYALALAEELVRPGLKLEEVFKNVARRVFETTKGTQRPWISLDVLGDFAFATGTGPTISSTPSTTPTPSLAGRWKVIEQVEPSQGGWKIEWDIMAGTVGSQIVFQGKKTLVNGKVPSRGELAASVEIKIPSGTLRTSGTATETNFRGEKILSDIECVFSPTWRSFEMITRVGGEVVSKMVGSRQPTAQAADTEPRPLVLPLWTKGTLKAELQSFTLQSATSARAVVKVTNTSQDTALKIAFDWENPGVYSPNPPPGSYLHTAGNVSLPCLRASGIIPLTYLEASQGRGVLASPADIIDQASDLDPQSSVILTLDYGYASEQRGFGLSTDLDTPASSKQSSTADARHSLSINLWHAEIKGEDFGRVTRATIQLNDIPSAR
jgi:hypothetical protein